VHARLQVSLYVERLWFAPVSFTGRHTAHRQTSFDRLHY